MRKNMVRLSDIEHAQLEKAREELMKRGLENLPEIKPICPSCRSELDDFKINSKYIKCSNCGYEEKSTSLTAIGSFAFGAIVGLGAAALIYLLSKDKKESQK
ncbi:MAG: hypothetical protein KJI71_00055 [Patescibacteria group bacterium]|nr:hypothetical protein [Patescibacteria group bacterium]